MRCKRDVVWVRRSQRRQGVLVVLDQPLTASQIAQRCNLRLSNTSFVLKELMTAELVQCLNTTATCGRVFYLTELGLRIQRELNAGLGLGEPAHRFPIVDWHLYGCVCFSHRAAVLKTLSRPIGTGEIRRRARMADSTHRMNTSNVRDVLQVLRSHKLVVSDQARKRGYPSWKLSQVGKSIQHLLRNAVVHDGRLHTRKRPQRVDHE